MDAPKGPGAGKIVAIGGAEDRTSRSEILKRVLDLAPAENRDVAVITTASQIPDQVFPEYETVFGELGATAVHHLNVRTREDARAEATVDRARRAGAVFMSGGDQLRLTNVLGASPLLAAMREARARGTVIAGTSAGAAAMSATMIYNGYAADALRKGAVKMSAGLAFIHGVVIDSHFLERGRFTRLMEVGSTNPEYIGLGLGEDAGVIVHDGHVLEAVGKGHVIVVDCTDLKFSNVADLSDGEPVAVGHVVMHALTSGYGYDVESRKFLTDADVNTFLEGVSLADSGAAGAAGAELL